MKNRAARILGLHTVCAARFLVLQTFFGRRAHYGLAFRFARFLGLLAISASLFASCSKASKKTELTILAAASLTDVCAELKTEYQKESPGVELFFSFGGSGALQAQVEAGAPCDIFLSAGKRQMDALEKQNLMEDGSVSNLLQNEVVLILPKDSALKISSFDELVSPAVKLVAVGEPQSVPVGQYAKAVCASLGIWEAVSAKANFASDVRTALSWVEEEACDCGIVYATDAASSQKVFVAASASKGSCPPVIYPVGIVAASGHKDAARAFVDFLHSKKAKTVFEKTGFKMADK